MDSSVTSPARPGSGLLKTVFGGAAVVAFLAIVLMLARSGGSSLPEGIVLYWGEGCPHCAKVEEFLQTNKVDQQVQITRKEVYKDRRNAREMARVAKQCDLNPTGMGVPFLWTGTTCLTGDKDIIAFFQATVGGADAAASLR